MAVLTGQLDGGLIGLSAGVAEENPIQAAAGGDRSGEFLLLWDSIQIGYVLQLAQLAA